MFTFISFQQFDLDDVFDVRQQALDDLRAQNPRVLDNYKNTAVITEFVVFVKCARM
jgi:hypothetical protein